MKLHQVTVDGINYLIDKDVKYEEGSFRTLQSIKINKISKECYRKIYSEKS